MTINDFLSQWHDSRATVPVYTSGSTGKPKLMMAEKVRMEASARMTCKALGLKAGDKALVCLPMDYIAGKMMVVRSLVCDASLQLDRQRGRMPQADGDKEYPYWRRSHRQGDGAEVAEVS